MKLNETKINENMVGPIRPYKYVPEELLGPKALQTSSGGTA